MLPIIRVSIHWSCTFQAAISSGSERGNREGEGDKDQNILAPECMHLSHFVPEVQMVYISLICF